MAINFVKDGTTYSLAEVDGSISGSGLSYVKDGTTYKAPAASTQGTSVAWGTYLIDNTDPTIHFVKDGTTYHCAKSATNGSECVFTLTQEWAHSTSVAWVKYSFTLISGTIPSGKSLNIRILNSSGVSSANASGTVSASSPTWSYTSGTSPTISNIATWVITGGFESIAKTITAPRDSYSNPPYSEDLTIIIPYS